MNRQNVIILKYGDTYEAWGSLTEICEVHGLSYNYLKQKKFPFKYREYEFIKVSFRKKANESNSNQ